MWLAMNWAISARFTLLGYFFTNASAAVSFPATSVAVFIAMIAFDSPSDKAGLSVSWTGETGKDGLADALDMKNAKTIPAAVTRITRLKFLFIFISSPFLLFINCKIMPGLHGESDGSDVL